MRARTVWRCTPSAVRGGIDAGILSSHTRTVSTSARAVARVVLAQGSEAGRGERPCGVRIEGRQHPGRRDLARTA